MVALADIMEKEWDAIIVGAGMGGATLGYALARAGKSVLFCEQGKSSLDAADALRGAYAETFFARSAIPGREHRDILLRSGRWAEVMEDASSARSRQFIPFIGAGTGGSSALYGMAMERFSPLDFAPRGNYPDASESALPDRWPISYDELRPYYEAAERLFRVRGTEDPLRPDDVRAYLEPPPLSETSSSLFQFLASKGLHPYRLPMACDYMPDCKLCQGYLCNKGCKNDSAKICLGPAVTQYGAHLLDQCQVLKLEATDSLVTGVVCRVGERQLTLRGKIVGLAAGALTTPAILQQSASTIWHQGLANRSGLVGKYLMRHFVDLYVMFPRARATPRGNTKEIAFNDFYAVAGRKLGSVQSFGALPPAMVMTETVEDDLRHSGIPLAASLFRMVKPAVRKILSGVAARGVVLASILEDLPYDDNAVVLPNGSECKALSIQYHIRPQDAARIQELRRRIAAVFKPWRYMLIKQAENNRQLAHACGTCRFGDNPADSVLDRNNRAHGLENLYVVDSSFFPSSAGTNPSLTIAANALRVADHISRDL